MVAVRGLLPPVGSSPRGRVLALRPAFRPPAGSELAASELAASELAASELAASELPARGLLAPEPGSGPRSSSPPPGATI